MRTIVMSGAGLALLLATACGESKSTVRPDEMSAAEHRSEADKAAQAAEAHERSYQPSGPERAAPVDTNVGPYFSTQVYNPTEWHLDMADRLREHAADHRKAAKLLEAFEAKECKAFPPATRAACPLLGPVSRIDDIPGGIRATFAPGTRVDAIVAHMRCHFAYAQTRGFGESSACPLYVRGIDIRLGAAPMTVEIASADANTTVEIRRRSREEAVFVNGR